MKRRLFNIAAAVSLVLCVLTVVLWVRGYWSSDSFQYVRGPRLLQMSTAKNGITVAWAFMSDAHADMREFEWGSESGADQNAVWDSPRYRNIWRKLGFVYDDTLKVTFAGPDGAEISYWCWELQVPIWPPTTITLILPIIAVRRFLRARDAARRGRCGVCGYDLRATPDRCPECGTIVTPRPERVVSEQSST